MDLPFTTTPGRRERHLRRRHENPLFAWPPVAVDPQALLAAQKADHEEMEAFRDAFRALVQRAVDLPPNADSDIVLALRSDLDALKSRVADLQQQIQALEARLEG